MVEVVRLLEVQHDIRAGLLDICFVPDSHELHVDSEMMHDVILYEAERDLVPPVGCGGGNSKVWHLDRVSYSGKPLPSGELNRSLGHWNPASQVELFQVEAGRIIIILASPDLKVIAMTQCSVGELALVPPGYWHLTYALEPSVVTNIYGDRAIATETSAVKDDRRSKYAGRHPVALALVHIDNPTLRALNDDFHTSPVTNRPPLTPKLLDMAGGLREMFRSADATAIERLERAIDRVLAGGQRLVIPPREAPTSSSIAES